MTKIRLIPGFQTYAASRDGRIWSLRFENDTLQWCHLRGRYNECVGYLVVGLHFDNVTYSGPKTYTVHGLIARTFIGERKKRWVIHHRDEDKFNNAVTNLEHKTRRKHSRDHCKSRKLRLAA